MTDTATFQDSVTAAAERIAEAIPQEGEVTAWELKVKLHMPSTMLYAALGYLMGRERVRMVQDGLDHRVSRRK